MRLAICIKFVDVNTVHLSKYDHVGKGVKEPTLSENKMGFEEHVNSYTFKRPIYIKIEFQHGKEAGCQSGFVLSSRWCCRLIYGRSVGHSLKCCVFLVLSR